MQDITAGPDSNRLHVTSNLLQKEAVAQRCSVEKMFLEISQNSQENTYARVSFLVTPG